MKEILKAVSEITQISEEEIIGNSHEALITEARFLFYRASKEKDYSQSAMGKFANRGRSSVFYLLTNQEKKLETDPILSSKYNKILELIGLRAIADEIEIAPFWNESFYIADMSSKYFGEYFVGMDKGIPVSCGGLCKVTNEMIGRYGTR